MIFINFIGNFVWSGPELQESSMGEGCVRLLQKFWSRYYSIRHAQPADVWLVLPQLAKWKTLSYGVWGLRKELVKSHKKVWLPRRAYSVGAWNLPLNAHGSWLLAPNLWHYSHWPQTRKCGFRSVREPKIRSALLRCSLHEVDWLVRRDRANHNEQKVSEKPKEA